MARMDAEQTPVFLKLVFQTPVGVRRLGSLVVALVMGLSLAGCGGAKTTKKAPVTKMAEDYKAECEGGNIESCFIAHESFVDRCRSAHDGWACFHAGLYWERGLGVVPNRDSAVAAFANACSFGYQDACTHEVHVGEGCWIGKACGDRCVSERATCEETPAP